MPAPVDDHVRRARIVAEADELHERLVAIRRDIHAHPEVGNAEHRTTARVVEVLESCGLVAKILPIGTGAWCDVLPYGFDEQREGLVGLRADLDALPIPDGSAVDFASRVPGVAHACGHDVHTTIVLGVGMILARLREDGLLTRGVRLIFQPAEETSPGGAVDAIDGGVLTDLTEVYALHCDPRTDAGQIALKVGPVTSAVSQISVTLTGTGGHTSRPHLTQDVVAALGTLATQTQLVFSRRVDPRSGVSMMWGKVSAGSAPNAIPSSGQIVGTLRALTTPGWDQAKAMLPELVAQLVAPFGVEARVVVNEGTPPAVNAQSGIDRLAAAGEAMLGPAGVTATEQSLGGEDFSWMLKQVPGAMARLGVRTPGSATWPDIHHPSFRVDESCIDVGVKVLDRRREHPEGPTLPGVTLLRWRWRLRSGPYLRAMLATQPAVWVVLALLTAGTFWITRDGTLPDRLASSAIMLGLFGGVFVVRIVLQLTARRRAARSDVQEYVLTPTTLDISVGRDRYSLPLDELVVARRGRDWLALRRRSLGRRPLLLFFDDPALLPQAFALLTQHGAASSRAAQA